MAERILVVGEALVDVVHRQDGSTDEHPGGSPANVAIGLARLDHQVDFAAHFGTDPRGESIREHLERNDNLHVVAGAQSDDQHTSVAAAYLDETGQATYDFDLQWDVADLLADRDAAPTGHLHVGSIAATLQPGASAVLDAVRRARETGTVSYDPNCRPSIMGSPGEVRAQIEEIIGLADVVKASDEDVAWLYEGAPAGEIMRLWGQLGPSVIVVTHGGDGYSVLIPQTGEFKQRSGYTVDVVDTVGAGDSFMSGLISGLLDEGLLGSVQARDALRQAPLEAVDPALRRAAACGAVTVARAGANPPTRAELSF